MQSKLDVHISSSPDLRLEREVLGRALAELPTTFGWRITRTPSSGKDADPKAIAHADAHILLLGVDIYAPMGVEWLARQRAGQPTLAWRKTSVRQTQSATAFIRDTRPHIVWQTFDDAARLRTSALRAMVDLLEARAARYELSDDELTKLRDFRASLGSIKTGPVDALAGASDGAFILPGPERYEPSNGVLIGERVSSRA